MPRKIFYPEQIIAKLRKIYALIGHAQPVIQAVRAAGISEQSDYHWCYEYGGNGLSRPGASRFLSAIRSLHTHQQFGILRNHDMRVELYYPLFIYFIRSQKILLEKGMLRVYPMRYLAIIATALSLAMPAHAQSEADCAARADRAQRESNSVVGGAAVGAAGGAVAGAILGDSRKATKRGAALGAVAGGTTNAVRKNKTYKQAYDDCMAGR